jgi:5-methylcytosine-specific restriction endonuclease McrA
MNASQLIFMPSQTGVDAGSSAAGAGVSASKAKIPRALREQVWLMSVGPKYETKCNVHWCTNRINVFDFHVGHNIPESKGGTLDIKNLQPICSRCNLSMGNQYSIEQWNKMSNVANTGCSCFR